MTQKELLRIRCNVYHLSIAQTSSLSIEIFILWSPLCFTVTLLVANTFSEGSSWLRFNLITLVQHSGDCRLPPAAQPAWHVPHTGLILQKGTQPPSAGTLGNKKFTTPGLSELLHKYLKEKVGSALLQDCSYLSLLTCFVMEASPSGQINPGVPQWAVYIGSECQFS